MGKKKETVTVYLVVDGELDIKAVSVPHVTEKCVFFELPNGTGEQVRVHKRTAGKNYFDTREEAAEYIGEALDVAIAEAQDKLAELEGLKASL